MKNLTSLLVATLLLAQLSACGSKGPLTLPEQKPASNQNTGK